ncbi:hypothetical protein EDC04DRAFT_2614948 [Pisolithus marmoratus]|nr:hypothetical protein EDC04DRAFT_2614948 [Pisolithus marmoratus]
MTASLPVIHITFTGLCSQEVSYIPKYSLYEVAYVLTSTLFHILDLAGKTIADPGEFPVFIVTRVYSIKEYPIKDNVLDTDGHGWSVEEAGEVNEVEYNGEASGIWAGAEYSRDGVWADLGRMQYAKKINPLGVVTDGEVHEVVAGQNLNSAVVTSHLIMKDSKYNNKTMYHSLTAFIAHLVNQAVVHEVIVLEMLIFLLECLMDDSIEIVVGFMHAVDKDKYKDNPIIPEGLDLMEEEELQVQGGLSKLFLSIASISVLNVHANIFKYDTNYMENEEEYKAIKAEILGEGSKDESGSEESREEKEKEEAEEQEGILDETEVVHKLLKIQLKEGEEASVIVLIAPKSLLHVFASDAISWVNLGSIKMNEDDTMSSSCIFIKIMVEEVWDDKLSYQRGLDLMEEEEQITYHQVQRSTYTGAIMKCDQQCGVLHRIGGTGASHEGAEVTSVGVRGHLQSRSDIGKNNMDLNEKRGVLLQRLFIDCVTDRGWKRCQKSMQEDAEEIRTLKFVEVGTQSSPPIALNDMPTP